MLTLVLFLILGFAIALTLGAIVVTSVRLIGGPVPHDLHPEDTEIDRWQASVNRSTYDPPP